MNSWTDYFPKHPFPMKATFQECFLVNFAITPSVIEKLLPPPITPCIIGGKAYLSVVIARLYRMRPSFIPAIFGVSFNQVVYRIVAECEKERGVYFLRSDANNRFMSLGGELLTNFNFHTSAISLIPEKGIIDFNVNTSSKENADISSKFDIKNANYSLPKQSRFADLNQAKSCLVELYQAFSINQYTKSPMTLKIKRGEWDIKVVNDVIGEYKLMKKSSCFNSGNTELDSIFYIKNVDYYWSRRKKLNIKS